MPDHSDPFARSDRVPAVIFGIFVALVIIFALFL
jgi:hypothetical protein